MDPPLRPIDLEFYCDLYVAISGRSAIWNLRCLVFMSFSLFDFSYERLFNMCCECNCVQRFLDLNDSYAVRFHSCELF